MFLNLLQEVPQETPVPHHYCSLVTGTHLREEKRERERKRGRVRVKGENEEGIASEEERK